MILQDFLIIRKIAKWFNNSNSWDIEADTLKKMARMFKVIFWNQEKIKKTAKIKKAGSID